MQDASTPAIPANSEELGSMAAVAIEKLTPFALNVVGALVVLVIGLWIAGRIKKIVASAMMRSGKMDATLTGFLSSLAYYGLVALVIITTLGVFGVPTTSFAAVIGAAGLAIGLALQGTLGHVASGVMMLGFRPFSVGDVVETGGHTGKVTAITLFTTELASPDNKKIIIPNGQVWDNSIVNYSAYAERRIDLIFGVSYSDDLDRAIDVVRSTAMNDPRVKADPEPLIVVESLGDSSVNILCRVWMASADYWDVKFALTKSVKEALDAGGLNIPFPTRTLIHENVLAQGETTP